MKNTDTVEESITIKKEFTWQDVAQDEYCNEDNYDNIHSEFKQENIETEDYMIPSTCIKEEYEEQDFEQEQYHIEENYNDNNEEFNLNGCDPLKTRKKKKLFDCLICTAQFKKRKLLTEHTDQDHDGKKIKCLTCLQSFTKMANLKRHMKTVHEGKRPYRCPECQSGFSKNSDLKTHILCVHGKELSEDFVISIASLKGVII